MGRVEAFEIAGCEAFFNSSDHAPAHIHVRKPGQWMIRVFFLLCSKGHLEYEVVFPPKLKVLPAPVAKEILKQVLLHRHELLREWDQKVCKR